jgi:hypothetical protein
MVTIANQYVDLPAKRQPLSPDENTIRKACILEEIKVC